MTKPSSMPPLQPWAELYNLESRLGQQQLPLSRKVGRPPASFPRSGKHMRFTADEIRLLASITGKLQDQFGSNKVKPGQVAGFALRLMAHIIDREGGLGDTKEFTGLWERLTGRSTK
jgi:hypothetical protein